MFNKLNFKLKCLLFCQNLLFFNYKNYSKCNICCCKGKNNKLNNEDNNDDLKNNDDNDLKNNDDNDKLNNEDNDNDLKKNNDDLKNNDDDNKLNNDDLKNNDDNDLKNNDDDNKLNNDDLKNNEDNNKLNNDYKNDDKKEYKKILSDVLLLFRKVEDKNNKLFDNKIDLGITRDQITATNDVKKLEEIKTILEKKSSEIENLKWVDEEETYDIEKEDTQICNNIDSFKNEFNNRKKLVKLKNAELLKKLQDNNPTEDQFNHYFDVYNKMTTDIFTHEVSVDLTIYIYILDLIGIINALNNIIKKEKLQYWIFAKFMYNKKDFGGTLTSRQYGYLKFEEKGGNNYNLYLNYAPKKDYVKYHSGQLDVEGERFKYLRCTGCTEDNCVSCKLRKFLENESLLDYFINIFKNQSNDSNSEDSLKIKNLIYLSLKKQYKNIEMYGWNNNKHKNYDNLFKYYELTNKIAFNFKKCVLLEWALTMEFLDRFIKEILDKDEEFKIYRSVQINEKSLKLVDFFESTSMFGPVFITTNPVFASRTNFFNISDFKLYRCLFHYIISPVKEGMFTALSSSVDYEQEIGYIPINQEWEKINDLENDIKNKNLQHLDSRNKIIDDLILNFLLKNLKKDDKYKGKKITIFEKFERYENDPIKVDNNLGTYSL